MDVKTKTNQSAKTQKKAEADKKRQVRLRRRNAKMAELQRQKSLKYIPAHREDAAIAESKASQEEERKLREEQTTEHLRRRGEGYIYCFSNPISQPGLCKVGMTERTPTERLREANREDIWRSRVCIYEHKQSITPYQLEFAKKVSNPKQKEQTLHKLLTHHTDPLNSIVSGHPGGILPKYFSGSKLPTENFYRELFRISPQEVSTFFELCDGELWDENAYETKQLLSILTLACPSIYNDIFDIIIKFVVCGGRRKRHDFFMFQGYF